jgi:putative glycosyltransferase (TIGR04372 family)
MHKEIGGRLTGAHLAIVKAIQLEVAASLFAGSNRFLYAQMSLKGWFLEALKTIPRQATRELILNTLDKFFLTTIRYPLGVSVYREIHECNPTLCLVLENWDFFDSSIHSFYDFCTPSNDRIGTRVFAYTPVIYISYASYQWLAPYIFYRYLIDASAAPLCLFYSSDPIIGTSEINNMILRDDIFRCVDCESNTISGKDLYMLYISGSSKQCIESCQALLYSFLDISSTYFFPSLDESWDGVKISNSQRSLIKHAQRLWQKRLDIHSTDSQSIPDLDRILSSGLPVIGIANRDPEWAGPGQPWRDTPIERFIPAIEWLLSSGYCVIRLNLVAKPLNISHSHYIDLCGRELSLQQQLLIYSKLSLCISSSSGIIGWPLTFFSVPTLLVDTAIAYYDGIKTDWTISTKTLAVKDHYALRRLSLSDLAKLLFTSIWSDMNLQKHGLKLNPLEPYDILSEVIGYVTETKLSPSTAKYTTFSLMRKYRINPFLFNQAITERTACNLDRILAIHQNLN